MKSGPVFIFSILAIIVFLFFPSFSGAEEIATLSDGQTIYVPAYSHIYIGNTEMPLLLTVTASIRNTDQRHSIKITKVDYYET